ncbi:MAG TPA: hypothetical protein VM870_03400, partial [Pyrinomonadaceae bacterium]|nr:hypothetical protein [Pyrinomonadaceae bacterium]
TIRSVGAGAAALKAPTILERTDQNFIEAILGELGRENGPQSIGKVVGPQDGRTVLKLFQPVHRTFHVALLDVCCDTFGRPRLDPRRIESAGLVVRRLAVDEQSVAEVKPVLNPEVREAWMQAGPALRGWIRLPPSQSAEELDPDPERRPRALKAGHPEIDRLLGLLPNRPSVTESESESVSPLFVAPPEVCAAAGRTILYGLIPLASTELSETPKATPPFDPNKVREHLSGFLRSGVNNSFDQLSGVTFSFALAQQMLETESADAPSQFGRFLTMLRQLAFEFNAFGETPDEAVHLYRELNTINLSFNDGLTLRPAGDFLKDAFQVLIQNEAAADGRPTVMMPDAWPALPAQTGERILARVTAAMGARLNAIKPQEGRFDDLTQQYRLRAFVRVRRPDGCPPQIIWSDYSNPFTIAPWYESNRGLPPVQVALPNVLNKEALKSLKPNVAFAVPKELFNFLQKNDPQKLVKGEGSGEGLDFGMDWICGFNIPIITLCAFIVLNIFLQLFNLIFQWLIFIKICIPFPKPMFKRNP